MTSKESGTTRIVTMIRRAQEYVGLPRIRDSSRAPDTRAGMTDATPQEQNRGSYLLRDSLDGKRFAEHLFRQGPQALGRIRIDRPGSHARKARVVGRYRLRDIAVLAIDTASRCKQWRSRAPYGGSCAA